MEALDYFRHSHANFNLDGCFLGSDCLQFNKKLIDKTEPVLEIVLRAALSTFKPIMANASTRVFSVHELAALILKHLPPKDLLRLQQLTRACYGAVNDDVRIGQKLYFRTRPKSQYSDGESRPLRHYNRFFTTVRYPIWSPENDSPWHLRGSAERWLKTMDSRCKVMNLDFVLHEHACLHYRPLKDWDHCVGEGSWRNMLFTKSLGIQIKVVLNAHRKGYAPFKVALLPAGTTIGEVCDWLGEAYEEIAGSGEWWRWLKNL